MSPNASSPSTSSVLGPSRRSTTAPQNSDVSRGWQEQIQSSGKVGLSSEREDDQDDVSSPGQVNDRMPSRPDVIIHCIETRLGTKMLKPSDSEYPALAFKTRKLSYTAKMTA